MNANPDLLEWFELDGTKPELVMYDAKHEEYVALGKKITKGLIGKFLKANWLKDKRLNRKKLSNNQLRIKKYEEAIEELWFKYLKNREILIR